MKKHPKYYGIVNHVIILLIFFVGMLTNYFILYPIIEDEESKRIIGDIERYSEQLIFHADDLIADPSCVDSLRKIIKDPYGGRLMITKPDGTILYDSEKESGNALYVLSEAYGEEAFNVLKNELEIIDRESRAHYSFPLKMSFFASYKEEAGIAIFYVAEYKVAGSKMIFAFNLLTKIMLVGAVLLIIISISNIRRLTKNIIEQTAANKDLETASAIQTSMLPRGSKHLLQLDVDARLMPAKKVGGDLYYYVLRQGVLYFCIGDVSGKGVPASLCMSRTVSLFRIIAMRGLSPAKIAENINTELCINNDQNMFVTAIIGAIRVFDGFVTYCNAGHEAPLYWNGREDSEVEYIKSSSNMPLGFDGESEFKEDSFVMEKNGMLLLYTDGVNEGRSRNGLYGRSRLRTLVERLKNDTASEINSGIISEMIDFEKGEKQSDDITLLTLRNVKRTKELCIFNDIKELKKLSPFCEQIFKECTLDSKSMMRVRAGLDEALTNCVRYAYDGPARDITMTASISEGKLIFEIRDEGIEFNPLEYVPEDTDTLKVGGLGISMIRSSFDDVKYARESGFNVLTLTKTLSYEN